MKRLEETYTAAKLNFLDILTFNLKKIAGKVMPS